MTDPAPPSGPGTHPTPGPAPAPAAPTVPDTRPAATSPPAPDGEGEEHGLARPPETFHRNRAVRDAMRRRSQWEVRVAKYRNVPPPPRVVRPQW
ncbi:hypothetical protein [Micromonospora wenchangensis]|uniref:hypothetical protein n=1 Tax=Micromonospora wenchangensis TaxID=1185415 RepID=UPI0037FAF9A5